MWEVCTHAQSCVEDVEQVPLWSRAEEGGLYCNYVAEIQRGMRAKFEVVFPEGKGSVELGRCIKMYRFSWWNHLVSGTGECFYMCIGVIR